ncbi:hypothetical protein PVK62_13505 [Aliivibrio sp. S3MY1]|uniref:hypothetical protein n=1 Tax=unclassified Aliivibrio TaxID=2645654 RepID=UPI00237953B2|nr:MULTISPECIES: hypothetical protein [unclassified Aliivibrio]MDD9196839.1 hypothetical protein [Aliivibrio sp. S3MY1]MDD9198071.1 hypothetical protein [Aliivibrio sp. S2MY1]
MDAPLDMKNGVRFKTKKHGYVTVIEYYNTHTVIVAFENTGNIRAISAAKLRSGQLADRSVPPESIMVGEIIESVKHGLLTIVQVESENIVLLTNEKGEEVRMLLPAVQKMKLKAGEIPKEEPKMPMSLSALTKRNKKTKDVNNLLKKMLTDYGK